MNTYLGTLKEYIEYDEDLIRYLESKDIKIHKYLRSLKILIISSEQQISLDDFDCFEILEADNRKFTV